MAPSSTFSSSGAICTLTVAAPLLQGDAVLRLVLNLASDKQVKVSQQKKGNELSLQMLDGIPPLTQRAAILRALAGPALHYALDADLLGGYGASSKNGGSATSVMAMSSLNSWMTVAHQVTVGASDKAGVLAQLEKYLDTKAFLIPSAQATLADMDLCAALLKSKKDEDAPFTVNVMRWMTTVHAQMTSLGATNLAPLDAPSTSMPAFFYGAEEFVALGKKPAAGGKPAAAGGKPAAAGGKPAAAGGGGGLTEEQKKAAADKKAKKNAEKAAKNKKKAPAPTAAADLDITALDIRVGKIVKAWHHPDAEKLFCEEIDLGEEGGPRQIASGLRPFYSTEDLTGRHVLVLCNLKSRNLVGFPSHGMVLCASNADHSKVEFVVPPPDAPLGERVSFGALDPKKEPEPENKVAKKKFAEKLLPDLKTNDAGEVLWKEHAAMTTKGAIKAVNGMANATVG